MSSRQNYDTFKHYCIQLGECDAELEKLMENYRAEVAKVEGTSYSPAKKRRDYKKDQAYRGLRRGKEGIRNVGSERF
ncbi:hypothetical protein NIB75_25885 [Bacteroides uniformis]|nr:hypothetical protein [Bacteroides uniformis]